MTIGSSSILACIVATLDMAAIGISPDGEPARFAAFGRPVPGDGWCLGEARLLTGLDRALFTGAAALRDLLSGRGPGHVGSFAETIGIRRVDFPLATWDSFLNVNTPADLEEARSQADRSRTGGGALG